MFGDPHDPNSSGCDPDPIAKILMSDPQKYTDPANPIIHVLEQ